MWFRQPDRKALIAGISVWKTHGALHVVTAATIATVLVFAGMHVVADRTHVLQQKQIALRTVADLAAQQTTQILVDADESIAALIEDDAGYNRRLPTQRIKGIRSIDLLHSSPHDVPKNGVAMPSAARPEAPDILLEHVDLGNVSGDAAVSLDTQWLARRYNDLSKDTGATIALVDNNQKLIVLAGRYGMLSARHRPVATCICLLAPLPGHSLTVVVGLPWTAVLRPWEATTTRLVLATLLIISLLLALSLRVERLERREARRLAHLSGSIARLSKQLDKPSLFQELQDDARAVVHKSRTCAVLLRETACGGEQFALRTRDGSVGGVLQVRSKRRSRLTGIERSSLEQLVYSASHALDVIRLLEERRTEAETAMALHRVAEQSRSQIETVFSAMPDAVMAVDQEWHPTFANKEAKVLLPLSNGAATDATLWAMLPPAVLDQVEASLRHAAASCSEMACQLRWPASGEKPERWFALRGVGHSSGMTLSLQDITRQIHIENGARQAAKMEAIGLLTGGIAHDFNNLLTVIMGNLEMLEMDGGLEASSEAAIWDALRAARAAADLTHQLLAFARKQPLAPRPVNVTVLLSEMMGLLKSLLGSTITITVAHECPLCHALVDPAQLQNVLINLAVNARDAMPDGGALAIRVSEAVIDADNPLAAEVVHAGNYLRIEIADTGHGIAAEHLSRIFEPFFTTKPSGAGTGLGLSMVYGFVKQSRGHVTVDSAQGQGTTITLYLPRSQPDAHGAAGARNREPVTPPGRGEIVLLVEDVPLVREQASRMLRRLGYQPVEAADGPAALAAIEAGVRPDLLLTDMELPGGMNGHDTARRLRVLLPELPVLFMTGYVENKMLSGELVVPGKNLLLKPFTLHRLANEVSGCLRS